MSEAGNYLWIESWARMQVSEVVEAAGKRFYYPQTQDLRFHQTLEINSINYLEILQICVLRLKN